MKLVSVTGDAARNASVKALGAQASNALASLKRARAKLKEANETAPMTSTLGALGGAAAAGAVDAALPRWSSMVPNSVIVGAGLLVYGYTQDELWAVSAGAGMVAPSVYALTAGAAAGIAGAMASGAPAPTNMGAGLRAT